MVNETNTFTLTQAQLNAAVQNFLSEVGGFINPVVSDVRTTRAGAGGKRKANVTLTLGGFDKITNDSQKPA